MEEMSMDLGMGTDSPLCIPLNCRGLQVLGFPVKDKIYLCVHQLAIELWKAYDTPRVSVQRKIIDLGIKIVTTDKNMIRILRAAGVIDNFRATLILLRDAEILCDALELSRRKRGLSKHALQSKHKPGERSTRPEELRARKFTAKMNSMYNIAQLQSQSINSAALTNSTKPQTVIHSASDVEAECKWASSRKSPPSPTLELVDLAFDTLLVVEDPVLLGDEACQEVISKSIEVTSFCESLVQITQEENMPTKTKSRSQTSKSSQLDLLPPPKRSNHSNDIQSPNSQSEGEDPFGKPLSSPVTETSELEDMYSSSSVSSRSRQMSTPERFLFLPESSESEPDDDDDTTFVPSSVGRPKKDKANNKDKSTLSSKRVVATKLRHFAQTSSPRLNVYPIAKPPKAPPLEPNSADPSQPLKKKRGRPPKVKAQPRPTALSSFAMKKRALSRSPSPVYSDGSNTETKKRRLNDWQREGADSNLSLSLRANNEVTLRNAEEPILLNLPPSDRDGCATPASLEDDIVSLTSVSTNSTNGSGQRSSTRVTRRMKIQERPPPQPFRFDDLFSFYPPKLVVRDGELVPERSLSIKKLDRSSINNLPDSHPFFNWTLGKPVTGKNGENRNGRKRKTLS